MSKEDINGIINLIKIKKSITSADISKLLKISMRRVFDVLPVLEVLGIVTRPSRGMVSWVEKKVPVDNNIYNCSKLIIHCIGVITEVKNLGMQITIEQTADGFTVEAVE